MKQYKFSVEDKFKYIKIAEFKVLKIATLGFYQEFPEFDSLMVKIHF
ncbi:hypothetical protein R7X45_02170 [Mesomycoplasma ovipneumoniae]|nr:hypothetical protein [Mesomycoplasma ovipneumoniae]MDW2926401.1 hypothetical protein [Mesomycoplasma ovipneumoniae]